MNTDLLKAKLDQGILVRLNDKNVFDLAEVQKIGQEFKTIMKVSLQNEAGIHLVFKIDQRSPSFIGKTPAGYPDLSGLKSRSCCDFVVVLQAEGHWEVLLVELVRKVPLNHDKFRAKIEQLVLGRFAVEYLLAFVSQFAKEGSQDVKYSYALLCTDGNNLNKHQAPSGPSSIHGEHPRSLKTQVGLPSGQNSSCTYGLEGKRVRVMVRKVVDEEVLRATSLVEEYKEILEKDFEDSRDAPKRKFPFGLWPSRKI